MGTPAPASDVPGPAAETGNAASGYPFPVILLDEMRRPAALSPSASELLNGIDPQDGTLGELLRSAARHAEVVVDCIRPDGRPLTLEARLMDLPAGGAMVMLRDLSGGMALRDTLAESRQRYRDLVEISSSFAWETGPDGRFTFVSPAGALGHAPDALIGRAASDFMPNAPTNGPCLPFEADRAMTEFELWMTGAAGETACLIASVIPLVDGQGIWRGARGVCRDITAMRERESQLAALHDRERRMAYILGAVNEIEDPDETLNTAAQAAARTFGAAACQLYRGTEPAELVGEHGAAPTTGDLFNIREGVHVEPTSGGSWLNAETRYDGRVSGAIRLWRGNDVAPWSEADRAFIGDVRNHLALVIEQAVQRKELHRLSSTDPLTGLENRRSFLAAVAGRLNAVSGGARQSDLRPAALLYIDLDNFKQVNDQSGHQTGDDVLRAVAEILGRGIREGDRIARLGGDEFALWLDGADRRGAAAKARHLLDASAELQKYSAGTDAPLGLSVGGAVFEPGSGASLNALVARADAAMYAAKRAGKNGFVIDGGENGHGAPLDGTPARDSGAAV